MPEVSCPNCSQMLNTPAQAVGKTAKCANCGHRFVIEEIEGEELHVPDAPHAIRASGSIPPSTFPTFERLASNMGTARFWRGATKAVGWIALIGGLIGMLDALSMKTTVEGVYNQGLMHDRLVDVMVSGLAILSGLLILCFLGLMHTIRERPPSPGGGAAQ
jgi:hypothetical protein